MVREKNNFKSVSFNSIKSKFMKKLIRKTTTAILSISILTSVLMSCSVDEKDLIGEWDLVSNKVEGAVQIMTNDERNQGYYFKEDGTFMMMMNMLTHVSRGTWSLDGSTLTMDINEIGSRLVEPGKHTIEINSLSHEELVMTTIVYDDSGKKKIGKVIETYARK